MKNQIVIKIKKTKMRMKIKQIKVNKKTIQQNNKKTKQIIEIFSNRNSKFVQNNYMKSHVGLLLLINSFRKKNLINKIKIIHFLP